MERQEERRPSDDPSSLPLGSQQEKLEDNKSLLEEVMFTKDITNSHHGCG